MHKIAYISSSKEFLSLRHEWNQLLSRSLGNNVFLTWEWLYTWWRTYGDSYTSMLLSVRNNNGKLMGVAPLMLAKSKVLGFLNRNEVKFMGTNVVCSEYLDFIIHPGMEQEVLQTIFDYLKQHNEQWDALNLTDVPESSINIQYISRIAKNNQWNLSKTYHTICPYITLPESWDIYEKSLSKKFRSNLRYYDRRLKRDFGQVEFNVYTDSSSMDGKMDEFIALHQKRWQDRNMPGAISSSKEYAFHKNVASLFSSKGWLRLYSLEINGEAIASLLAFEYKNNIYFYKIGSDPDLSKYSAGTLLQSYCIEDAISREMKKWDLLRGDEEYKYKWGVTERNNIRIVISKPSRKEELFRFLSRLKGTVFQAARLILPNRLAQALKERIEK